MRIHLDTDFGGDTDDACALAMLLGWPDVEIVGITTVADPGGRRAGYLHHPLDLAGRRDIPVAAGARRSLTHDRISQPVLDDRRHWPVHLTSRPSPPGAALDLLHASIEQGATVVAIGPYTNLALLEVARPGRLGQVPVVATGGWLPGSGDGLPGWGPEMDWNVQWDIRAAEIMAAVAQLTLVPLPVTMKAHVRGRDLPRLRASGAVGRLLASQAEAHGHEFAMAELGRAHAGLPDDLLNFQYDPVACAVALDWRGATVEPVRLRPVATGTVLRFLPDPQGRPARVVVDIDGDAFVQTWLRAVEAAQR